MTSAAAALRPGDLLDANESLLSALCCEWRGTIEDGCTVPDTVSIGEGTVIRAGTYIEGHCAIGENCVIGPHAYIRGSTAIGDGCHIGHATEIKNSIVMARTNIPHFNYVGDSTVGSGCNFGAGTKVATLRHANAPVQVCGRWPCRLSLGRARAQRKRWRVDRTLTPCHLGRRNWVRLEEQRACRPT